MTTDTTAAEVRKTLQDEIDELREDVEATAERAERLHLDIQVMKQTYAATLASSRTFWFYTGVILITAWFVAAMGLFGGG